MALARLDAYESSKFVRRGYLAARYSRRLELCDYKVALEERGYHVPARWLLGKHQVEGLVDNNADTFVVPNEEASGFAIDDAEDIDDSDFLIAFTEEPRVGGTRGGRHWELGYASGLRRARWPERDPRIFLVGPLEHVFTSLPLYGTNPAHPHALIDARFETFTNFLVALDNGDVAL